MISIYGVDQGKQAGAHWGVRSKGQVHNRTHVTKIEFVVSKEVVLFHYFWRTPCLTHL